MDKVCTNYDYETDVRDQMECRENCGWESTCVGYSYGLKQEGTKYCYLCNDDVLVTSVERFAFYRKPSESKSVIKTFKHW